jgi:hypothetical protein
MAEIGRHDRIIHPAARIQRALSTAVSSFVSAHVDVVSKGSLHLYDKAIAPRISKETAKKIRPNVMRAAEVAGVSLVAVEAVIAVVGVAKGIKWLQTIRSHQQIPSQQPDLSSQVFVGDSKRGSPLVLPSRPLSAGSPISTVQAPEERWVSPEERAYKVLVDEISQLKKTGKASEQLQRMMFMTAHRVEGGHIEAEVQFMDSATRVLEYLTGNADGKRVLNSALAKYDVLRLDPYTAENPIELYTLVDSLTHIGQLEGVEPMSVNLWTWGNRGIGLRELLGIPPNIKIYELDYGSQWIKQPIPYIQYVQNIVDRCKRTSHDWAFQ